MPATIIITALFSSFETTFSLHMEGELNAGDLYLRSLVLHRGGHKGWPKAPHIRNNKKSTIFYKHKIEVCVKFLTVFWDPCNWRGTPDGAHVSL